VWNFRRYVSDLLLACALACLAFSSVSVARAQGCSQNVTSCTISGGLILIAGQSIQVGTMSLTMQADGNLALSQAGVVLWSSSKLPAQDLLPFSGPTQGMSCAGCYAAFQTDGNLVLYQLAANGTAAPYWASNTPQNVRATLKLSYASPLAIVGATGSVLWSADIAPITATNPVNLSFGSAGSFAPTGNAAVTSGGGAMLWSADVAAITATSRSNLSFGSAGSIAPIGSAAVTSGGGAIVGVDPYDKLMSQLWEGSAHLQPIVNMQIPTTPASGAPFVDGMDEGTRIISVNGSWYLFSREYNYAPNPVQCTGDFSRIVVRASADHGRNWGSETVVAEPNLSLGECALADGFPYWDADTGIWHYLVQMLKTDGTWNIDHFTLQGPNPVARFAPDLANPVVQSGALWSSICGTGKSCPAGTMDEGTPEITSKANGLFYVTFHGVSLTGSPPIAAGYRGIAATADFRTWITSGNGLPGDAIWSSNDCQKWSVKWSPTTGCVGGGDASSLRTSRYTYMLIESSDISVGCVPGQDWAIGLVRAPAVSASGHWEQLPSNPMMNAGTGAPCGLQYPTLFKDSGQVYASYWTLGTTGANDPNTYFHIARLRTN
jgi:hypothetical protein